MTELGKLHDISVSLRRLIIETVHHAGMGHTGGSLSEVEILAALYFRVLRGLNPGGPSDPARDRFILSKGHATPGYYSVLALRGFFPVEELKTFDSLGSRLQAHPDMKKTPGVDISSGSLGQGLSCGIGMATASARDGSLGGFVTFVLLGDGELQEGQVWEAALYAGSRKLPRLVAVVDANGVQLASLVSDSSDPAPLADKWRAFGWQTFEADGHDAEGMAEVLEEARVASSEGPVAVIARTVKGKGVSFMEGRPEWHGKAPNDMERDAALKEISDAR